MARRSMAIRVLGAFLLGCMILTGGCYDAKSKAAIAAAIQALTILADGGAAAANDGSPLGQGGGGGSITATANADLSFGQFPAPALPAIPPAPTTGDTPLLDGTDTNPASGNWLIAGTITTSAGGALTLTTTTGDIIVSGTLIGEDLGASRADVTLSAPNGTVYVSGTINLAGAAGDAGGTLTVNARRIVVWGRIDVSGGDTAAAPGAGSGDINLNASALDILLSGATLNADGGDGTTGAGGGGTIALDSQGGRVFLYGTFTVRGGAADDPVGAVIAGSGGTIDITDADEAHFNGMLDARGGDARTTGAGATGGPGGDINFPGDTEAFVYGSIDLRGGSARAASGAVNGGSGGDALIGDLGGLGTRALFIRGGTPHFSAKGGEGGSDGGSGGNVTLGLEEGIARILGTFDCSGGNPTAVDGNGGSGGNIEFRNGSTGGSGSGRPRRYEILPTSVVRADGGRGNGTGDAGDGGSILVFVSENIVTQGLLSADGGDAFDGTGGRGGGITLQANSYDHSNLILGGTASATGGSSTLIDGNDGGTVDLITNGSPGDIEINGVMDVSGGPGTTGAGQGGTITGDTQQGHVWVFGTLRARGGDSPQFPNDAGAIDLSAQGASGDVLIAGVLDVTGGGATNAAANGSGRNGGLIVLDTTNGNEPIVLAAGSSVLADGGAGSGTGTGGNGGQVNVAANGAASGVTLAGSVRVRGGACSSGIGGPGGGLLATSNNGNVTVAAGATIDASGGAGTTGGNARNDATPAQATPGGAAVQLDADPANAAAPSGGTVVNNGSITANAGSAAGEGGDVLFDGNDGAGGAPVAGTQSRNGTPAGDYDSDVP